MPSGSFGDTSWENATGPEWTNAGIDGGIPMSESSHDGSRSPGRARPIGTSAALFEHAPQPMAAVRGVDDSSIEVVNLAYLERFEGRSSESDDGGCFRHESHLCDAERSLVRTAADGTVDREVVSKTTPDGRRTFAVRAIPADRIEIDAYLQYREITTERIRTQQLDVLRRVLRHDLRNDLTVLLGYAETIAETASDPEIRDQATTMVEAAGDLRSVAASAGRMQCVTAAPESIDLDDAVVHARRAVSAADASIFPTVESVPRKTVDRRIAVALEELSRTLVERGGAAELDLSVETGGDWATLTLDADASLCEQERAALAGHDETKLRHATGLSPWIARWAVRVAGGRLRTETDDGRCTIVVEAPIREARNPSQRDAELRSSSWADD